MAYQILIDPAAVRELKKFALRVRRSVAEAINALAENPRPLGSRKLAGSTNGYRIRVGDYRISYHIADKVLHVLIVKVGNRKGVYR
ncbi:MAG: type II toxin-antitoxin system RelE family toxin [Gemmatimonadaceae bacterium]